MLYASSVAHVTVRQDGVELQRPGGKLCTVNLVCYCVRGYEVEVEFTNLTAAPTEVALTDVPDFPQPLPDNPQFVPVAAKGTHVFRFTPAFTTSKVIRWGTRSVDIKFIV